MTTKLTTPARIAAGVAAAATALMAAGTGQATAAPDTTTWEDGNSGFSMTVSDATPAVGDTITLATTFKRKWSFEDVYNFKALFDGCFEYVEGSGKWQDSPVSPTRVTLEEKPAGERGSVRLESTGGGAWRVPGVGAGWGEQRTISVQLYVTRACATGQPTATTMHYGGSLGSGTYNNPTRGPNITVATLPTDPGDGGTDPGDGGTDPGGDAGGDGSLGGGLGSLFG